MSLSLNRPLISALTAALALSLGLMAAPHAEAATKKAAATSKSKAKAKAKTSRSKGKTVAKAAVAAAPLVIPPADAAQLEVASRVYYGSYSCEFGQTIDVSPSTEHPGYADLKSGKNTWLFKPVQSSTGAIRLEDVKGDMLLLQIAFKSMLMNVKTGERVLDGCESTEQAKLKADYDKLPQNERGPGVLDQTPPKTTP
ncbi:hypothetical protein [Amphibiibacter pelophylacis]|uniref:Uncharacterized protein n=1 Tax=Amphibiibacter pelophylacis TaxID=1799477 RepID=A0ACC6P311_9BURK